MEFMHLQWVDQIAVGFGQLKALFADAKRRLAPEDISDLQLVMDVRRAGAHVHQKYMEIAELWVGDNFKFPGHMPSPATHVMLLSV